MRKKSKEPDFLLIQKIKNGESEAGERLIKKYYSSVYQYCFLHIRDNNYAEDFTQETFARFFESLKTYKEYGKTKSYLYCIAGNIIKNHYAKKKDLLLDEIPEIPENTMTDIEIRMDIEHAIDELSDEMKEVVILFFFQGLKQKEIAEVLNIKLSLVKYRISKSKKILAEYLGNKTNETI